MRRETIRRPPRGLGFTFLELLIVMVVISIIIAFILTAAFDGIQRAEERSTHALISKIDAGLTDRLDALTTTRADYNAAHAYIAAMWPQGGVNINGTVIPFIPDRLNTLLTPAGIPRAAAIAQFDRLKAELPDVFTIQNDGNYPFNFAAMPYSGGPSGSAVSFVPAAYAPYLLPIGVGIVNDQTIGSYGGNPSPLPIIYVGGTASSNFSTFPNSTGIFGASYAATGGLTKQLAHKLLATTGNSPSNVANWYDGTDNNQNGLIDELGESGYLATDVATVLANHTHKTARSEILYALLVYSTGPLGSTFSPEDFDDSQVKDTDGDGLMEFVDAWGEPLQFYRWPILYYGQDPNRPDVQRGYLPYPSTTAPRDQNPLDPNQQLLAPAWWGNGFNVNGPFTGFKAGGTPLSGGASLFQQFFHTLVDPNTNGASGASGTFWDRGGTYLQRRAYYSKPLILSSGPNKLAGVPRLDGQYFQALAGYASQKYANGYLVDNRGLSGPGNSGFSGSATTDTPLLLIENQAAQLTPNGSGEPYQTAVSTGIDVNITGSIQDVGADDITNHNLSAPGGVVQ